MPVTAAMQRAVRSKKVDIAIASCRSVARPFVAEERDELTWRMKFRNDDARFLPATLTELKVVRLMTNKSNRGNIARIAHGLTYGSCPDSVIVLSVQITPKVAPTWCVGQYADRV